MNTDRELLELAAKAASIEGKYGYAPDDYYYNGNVEGICTELPDGRSYVWNPLSDDGDAMRLAVKLQMRITNEYDKVVTAEFYFGEAEYYRAHEFVDGDPFASTRRAIVRAAAEIGRSLK